MKTKFKLFIVLLATFCIALTCGLVAACQNDITDPINPEDPPLVNYGNPATDGYVITVLYPDGSPVKNTDGDTQYDHPTVELIDRNGTEIASAQINASGVAYIDYLVPGEYFINVIEYPSGYFFDNTSVKTSADRAFYTVSLEFATETSYAINLKYPDGTAMPDVNVKLMDGEQTVATATTDENGVAATPVIDRGVYGIALDLPPGYGYKAVSTTIAARPITIKTVVLRDITFEDEDKLDEDGIKPWDDALNSYAKEGDSTTINNIKFKKDADCYQYTAEFGAGEEVFFKIHAPKTGSYTIGSKNGNNYVIQFYSDDLTYCDSGLTISSAYNNGNNIQRMQIYEEGETLTFSVKSQNRQAGTVDVLICLPVPTPKTVTATKVGTYTLTFDNINEAILNFVTSKTPSEGFGQGNYKITSLSDTYDVMIIEYSFTGNPVAGDGSDLPPPYTSYNGNDNGANDGLNFVLTNSFPVDYLGNTIPYHIIIKGETVDHPVQIDVKIERTGDAVEKEITRNTATTNVSEKYADQNGTFTWMPTDGSLQPYRKDDGKWYVNVGGTEKALVVAITKELNDQEYSFATIEYLADGEIHNKRVNANLTVYEDTTKQDTTWNYTNFIDQYKGCVNSDGVYQVNDELKLFLERYMNQNFHNITGSQNKPALPWLLGCGYYA